ncbi:hypothetical protein N7448_003924 [Penicillium atrosanguineum]|nr:hypothetical protein N7448_003924 [Penicillium atrosanguineum]
MAPITFYDIALAPPAEKTSCSPNPWKTRYALNFKKTPYKTTWVPLGEISSVRAALNIPASRTFADGSPYQTLPVISDPATGRIVGDSFENAVYLQEQYPSSGAGDLVPSTGAGVADGPLKAYLKFNTNVDAAFTAYTQLVLEGFPFDPDTAEEDKAMMSGRIGVPWEALRISEEKRAELFKAFEETLGGASYADFIVGGWLRMYKGMLSAEEFKTLKGWHNGVFGKLHEALEVFAQMD